MTFQTRSSGEMVRHERIVPGREKIICANNKTAIRKKNATKNAARTAAQ